MPNASNPGTEPAKRPRGRPRRDINLEAVADAVAELFAEGGMDSVSILEAAEKLSVSRATLYRTVPTKEDLLGILFERSTRELLASARSVVDGVDPPRAQLDSLLRLHIDAAIRMRSYMPVFFDGGGLPPDVVERWSSFSHEYEELWIKVVTANMDAGDLLCGEPVVATRLLLGACIWVSRWYRAAGPYDPQLIADTAVSLLRHGRADVAQGTQQRLSDPPGLTRHAVDRTGPVSYGSGSLGWS